MNATIQQADAAIRAGDRQKAHRLLARVIQADPQGKETEEAWILMSSIVQDPKRKRQSLEAALAINPDSEVAKQRLGELEQAKKSEQPADVVEPPLEPPTATEKRDRTDPSTVEEPRTEVNVSPEQNSTQTPLPVRDLNISINPLQIVGLIGVFLLILGVFTPIIKRPIVGDMNYFQNGQGDGVFVLLLAVASLVLILLQRYRWLWITGPLTLTFIGSTLLYFIWVIAQLQRTLD